MEQEHEAYPARLSVVIPVYNEESTLPVIVQKLLKIPYLLEIIIVDDCSTDGTNQVAHRVAEKYGRCRLSGTSEIQARPKLSRADLR